MSAIQRLSNPSPRETDGDAAHAGEIPRTLDPGLAAGACRLMARAEAMGLVDVSGSIFDGATLDRALRGIAAAGIGRQAVARLSDRTQLGELVKRLNLDLEDTPVPDAEWSSVVAIVGMDATATLVDISNSSARRYLAGERATPDVVAARLHFLALVIADLMGSYNSYGIRRWFERPRSALGGQSPREALGTDWDPTDEAAGQVADLAASLMTMVAT